MNVGDIKTRVWQRLDERANDPQRFKSEYLTEYINDGLQYIFNRTGLITKSATITAEHGQFLYDLPADCIRVRSVKDDDSGEYLTPITMWELDRLYFRATEYGGTRATNYTIFSHNKIGLWPIDDSSGVYNSQVNDLLTINEQVEADGLTSTYQVSGGTSSGLAVYWNGVRLSRVASAPAAGEFTETGGNVTLGTTPDDGDTIQFTYAENPNVVIGEIPSGDIDGVNQTFVVSETPVGAVSVYHNGIRLRYSPESGNINEGEYSISGRTILVFSPPDVGDIIEVDYSKASGTAAEWGYGIPLTGYDFGTVPASAEDVAAYLNGVRLKRVYVSPDEGQYRWIGPWIELGTFKTSTDSLVIDYKNPVESSAMTYTILYTADSGLSLVDSDSDTFGIEIDLPIRYEHLLIDYVTARAVLPRARGLRLQRAQETLTRFIKSVDELWRRDATLVRTWAP